MAPDPSTLLRCGECCLTRALSALAHIAMGIGADSVSVMLVEKGSSLRVVYHWPETSAPSCDLRIEVGAVGLREGWDEAVDAESAIGRFLTRATGSTGPFFLVPWPDRHWNVIIAFGIRSSASRLIIPGEISPTIQLAALATWSTVEAQRLRNDLSVANERLGGRKMVERAKGLLQAQNGWSEQQAYEQLRKLSRQRRKTMAETAQDLLRFSRAT